MDIYQIIYDVFIGIVDVAILVYVAAEYYSSKRLEDKLVERLKKRKAAVKAGPSTKEPEQKNVETPSSPV